jgi:hypothetical protein
MIDTSIASPKPNTSFPRDDEMFDIGQQFQTSSNTTESDEKATHGGLIGIIFATKCGIVADRASVTSSDDIFSLSLSTNVEPQAVIFTPALPTGSLVTLYCESQGPALSTDKTLPFGLPEALSNNFLKSPRPPFQEKVLRLMDQDSGEAIASSVVGLERWLTEGDEVSITEVLHRKACDLIQNHALEDEMLKPAMASPLSNHVNTHTMAKTWTRSNSDCTAYLDFDQMRYSSSFELLELDKISAVG